MRIGIYPGTFDPATRGHLDIISRAARLVDRLIVGVAANAGKGPMFPLDERCAIMGQEVAAAGLTNVVVLPFSELLIDFARKVEAAVIFRGLRAISDFEYEFQMAGMNRNLCLAIETLFLMSAADHQFVSSRFVKEIARLGGDVTNFVSPVTMARLQAKLAAGVEPNIEPRLIGTDPP